MGTGVGHGIPPISNINEWSEGKRRSRERQATCTIFKPPRISRTGTIPSIERDGKAVGASFFCHRDPGREA